MQSNGQSTSDDDDVIHLPRYAINMARRVMTLMATADIVGVTFVRVGDTWYIAGPGGKLERL